jgi:hypothetical protein
MPSRIAARRFARALLAMLPGFATAPAAGEVTSFALPNGLRVRLVLIGDLDASFKRAEALAGEKARGAIGRLLAPEKATEVRIVPAK